MEQKLEDGEPVYQRHATAAGIRTPPPPQKKKNHCH
jgi:hypothetical protein